MKLHRIFFFTFVLAFAALLGSSRALGLPSIPGVPGVPGVNTQQIAINAASKQLAPWVRANQPIVLDWSAVFPNSPTLPGAPFNPTGDTAAFRTSLEGQLAHSSTGVVNLQPGDYSVQFRVYCTDIHRHAGHQSLWVMGPLKGARANLLAAMYARASGRNLPFGSIQTLSWAMQAGLRYDQLNPAQRALFDQLIPDFHAQAAGNFLEQTQDQWNTISSAVPGLPSMDSAIGSMGDLGQTILQVRDAQGEILSNANSFDALSRALAPPGGSGSDAGGYPPPWSQVATTVYERVVTLGTFGTTGELDIRVVGPGQQAVPITNVISYPPNHKDWQPLTQESPQFAWGPINIGN